MSDYPMIDDDLMNSIGESIGLEAPKIYTNYVDEDELIASADAPLFEEEDLNTPIEGWDYDDEDGREATPPSPQEQKMEKSGDEDDGFFVSKRQYEAILSLTELNMKEIKELKASVSRLESDNERLTKLMQEQGSILDKVESRVRNL